MTGHRCRNEHKLQYPFRCQRLQNLSRNINESDKEKRASALDSTVDLDVGYVRNHQVFSDFQELELEKYIKSAAAKYFGLTS